MKTYPLTPSLFTSPFQRLERIVVQHLQGLRVAVEDATPANYA